MRSATCSSAGREPTRHAAAVAFGSHLDTVPTGGRFDGVLGVLAGLEVMRTLDQAGIRTRAPLELVNWTNEEGSRFRPAMMGSRVPPGELRWRTRWPSPTMTASRVAQALRRRGPGRPADPVAARLERLAGSCISSKGR